MTVVNIFSYWYYAISNTDKPRNSGHKIAENPAIEDKYRPQKGLFKTSEPSK